MASDDEDVPDSGAVFTFGKSRFLDNKFWIRDDAVIHLACGDEHSAVVTGNGKLYTFGSNDWGQLGHGNTVQFPSPKLVKRLKPERVNLVAAGRNHTIVSTESGKLFTFGCGSDGQLGHGDSENSTVPKVIESLADQQYRVLACGADFTAAVTDEGELYSWGSSSEGQTGQGDEDCVVPTKVHLKGKVSAVACGYYHMAVVTDDGSLYTCGETESGKLGLDESQLRDTSKLQKLFINEQVTAVACGGNHTVVVTASGKLFTFGQGDHGQLGHGTSMLECTAPKQVTSLGNVRVKFVACGESHTAIITKHGNLYTCGDGRHGKLGMGEESFSNLFKLEKVRRFDGFTVQKVACGGCHTLVTAFKTSEVIDGTDSEAEAEKDMLSASISSTKSLQDAVDGPTGPRGGLAATLPAGSAARNKRRQRNRENLGNSIGGSLPPISKSTLPPLSQTLPALKKEPLNQEKIPVNPLNMSTLPKISQEDSGGDKRHEETKSVHRKDTKETTPSKKQKNAESSSGISESEDDEEDEDEGQDKKEKEKTAVTNEEQKKDEESEESMTEDESDSEEEETAGSKNKTDINKLQKVSPEKDEKKKKVPSKKEEDEDEEEESEEDDEESDDEEDDEDSAEEGKKTAKNEQLEVVGKKLDVTKVEKTKKGEEDEDEESEEEESDEEEEEDKEAEASKKKTQDKEPGTKGEDKEKGKKLGAKKKQKEEEESQEDEDEDEEGESEADEKTKDKKKDKKAKDDKDAKKKKQKKEQHEDDESKEKDKDDKKDKKKTKKGKDQGSKKKNDEEEGEVEEEDVEADKEDETEKEKGDKEEDSNQGKKDKKEDTAGKPEAGKKGKKSGICVLL